MLKKEIVTVKELDLRPLGKVIIFRDKLTGGSNRPFRCLDCHMSFSNPQYFRKQILKPSIFQATNLQGLNSSGNKLTSSPNPQYFWQQIDQLFKSTIFLATDWPYLQILDISGNKLTSSAGNRVARMASQLFDAHRRRREEPGETYNSDIAFNLIGYRKDEDENNRY